MTAFFHDWHTLPSGLDACSRCGGLDVCVGRNTECPVPAPAPEPRGHDWRYAHGEVRCSRCGVGDVPPAAYDACPGPLRPGDRGFEPKPEPKPTAAQLLDRALTESAFDRLDRRHKR